MNNLILKRQDNESTVKYLERIKKEGFLFHGSNNKDIKKLETRYTFDPSSKENTDTAVFATSNVCWAMIFGLYGGHKGWATSVSNGKVTAKIPKIAKELIVSTIGTVYVLSPETFESTGPGEQHKSIVSVKPLDKIDVTLDDYYELGGKIEWL